jgi:two-component system sensor histidine kinase CpxA
MKTLFIKIFIWFCLTITLVVISLIIAAMTLGPVPIDLRLRFLTGHAISLYGNRAAEIFENNGQSALNEFFTSLERKTGIRFLLYDEQNKEVSGLSSLQEINELVSRAKKSGRIESEMSGRVPFFLKPLLALRIMGPGGNHYVIASRLPHGPFVELSHLPWPVFQRLIVILITSGVLCYFLARYLTAPISKLQAATKKLAGGDLTVRVGSKVGKRRDEIADLARDFDLMAERIELVMTSQRRLLGDVSHELRSPLARLNVALELARQRAGHKAESALNRIECEAERLNELIGQLLMLTRLESKTEKREKVPIDLADLIYEIATDADFEAQNRKCSVRVIIKEEFIIPGIKELLRSAVENVVRNAIRYTAEGTEIEITLHCRQENNNIYAVISIRDHGTGVPDEALSRVFRPFYSVSEARDRQTGGTGLGLAITERAVKLHDGNVTAANAPGGGLIIEIHFPVTDGNGGMVEWGSGHSNILR